MGAGAGAGPGLIITALLALLGIAAVMLPIFVVGIYQHLGRIRKLQVAQLEALDSMDRSLRLLSREVADAALAEFDPRRRR